MKPGRKGSEKTYPLQQDSQTLPCLGTRGERIKMAVPPVHLKKRMKNKVNYAPKIRHILEQSAVEAARKKAPDKGLTIDEIRQRVGRGSRSTILASLKTLEKTGTVAPPAHYRLCQVWVKVGSREYQLVATAPWSFPVGRRSGFARQGHGVSSYGERLIREMKLPAEWIPRKSARNPSSSH